MQDKTASAPDLELVGHTDTAAFALGMCTSEPLVASGGKDTNVSCPSHTCHAECVCLADVIFKSFCRELLQGGSIVSNLGLEKPWHSEYRMSL